MVRLSSHKNNQDTLRKNENRSPDEEIEFHETIVLETWINDWLADINKLDDVQNHLTKKGEIRLRIVRKSTSGNQEGFPIDAVVFGDGKKTE